MAIFLIELQFPFTFQKFPSDDQLLIRYSQGKNGEGERESVPNNTRRICAQRRRVSLPASSGFLGDHEKKKEQKVFSKCRFPHTFKPKKKCRSSKIKLIFFFNEWISLICIFTIKTYKIFYTKFFCFII